MTFLPQPWCSKDPRSTIKAVGILEILFSVVGLIILVILPVLLLQLEHEINYIEQHHHGIQISHQSSFSDPLKQLYILNTTEYYLDSCDVVMQSMRHYLVRYTKGHVYYDLSLNRSMVVNILDEDGKPTRAQILCEIHVYTRKNPTTKILRFKNETVDIHYSIRDILVECIQRFTGEETEDIENKMTVSSPNRDEISQQKIYPVPVGNDPARQACINEEMRGVDTNDVLEFEFNMYKLLGCSGVCAMIGGFILTSTAFTMSRFAIMVTFLMEITSVGMMAGGIVVLNSPLLCLFQYGGISAYSLNTPTHMQTIITYSCAVYCASFKLYLLWNAMAYAEVIPKLKAGKSAKVSPNYSNYVAEVAEEVAKRNKKLAEGGKWSDESDYSDDSDQWTDEKSTVTSTSTTVASRRSMVGFKSGVVGPPSSILRRSEYGSTSATMSGRSTSTTSGKSAGRVNRSSSVASGRSGLPGKFGIGNRGRIFQPSNTLVAQKRDRKFLENSLFGY